MLNLRNLVKFAQIRKNSSDFFDFLFLFDVQMSESKHFSQSPPISPISSKSRHISPKAPRNDPPGCVVITTHFSLHSSSLHTSSLHTSSLHTPSLHSGCVACALRRAATRRSPSAPLGAASTSPSANAGAAVPALRTRRSRKVWLQPRQAELYVCRHTVQRWPDAHACARFPEPLVNRLMVRMHVLAFLVD